MTLAYDRNKKEPENITSDFDSDCDAAEETSSQLDYYVMKSHSLNEDWRIIHNWRKQQQDSSEQVAIKEVPSDCCRNYLIDDDEDRRDLMTEAACRIVSTASNELSVSFILTLRWLFDFLGDCKDCSDIESMILKNDHNDCLMGCCTRIDSDRRRSNSVPLKTHWKVYFQSNNRDFCDIHKPTGWQVPLHPEKFHFLKHDSGDELELSNDCYDYKKLLMIKIKWNQRKNGNKKSPLKSTKIIEF